MAKTLHDARRNGARFMSCKRLLLGLSLAALLAAGPALAQSSGGGGSSSGGSSSSGSSSGSSGGLSSGSSSGGSLGGSGGLPSGATSPPGTVLPPPSTGLQGTAPSTGIGTNANPGTSAATPGGSNAVGGGTPGLRAPETAGGAARGVGNPAAAVGNNPSGRGSAGPGIGGARTGASAGGTTEAVCNDVLSKPGDFTKSVVDQCRKATGKEPSTRTAEPDREVAPIDRPAQVQKQKELQDRNTLRSVCTNCGGIESAPREPSDTATTTPRPKKKAKPARTRGTAD